MSASLSARVAEVLSASRGPACRHIRRAAFDADGDSVRSGGSADQLEGQSAEEAVAGERWQDFGLAFTTSVGTPLDSGRVTRRLQQLLAAGGLPRLRFHDLRHGYATCCSRGARIPAS